MKQITERKALEARALFIMAADHAEKSMEFERALSDLLGYKPEGSSVYMGHLSDAVYNSGKFGFDDAFKKEGFSIRKPRPTKKT